MSDDNDVQSLPQNDIKLKTFFVYELIDPRNNSVFYVGKGQGRREYDHVSGDMAAKGKRILDIEKAGYDVERVIIGRYDTDSEAFAVETALIKWVYGLDNLTNIVSGKYHSFVRSNYQKTKAEYLPITGIDREKALNIHTGNYTEELRRRITDNNIYEKLEVINQYLFSELPSQVKVSEPNINIPQDPHILITGFSDSVSIVLKLRLSGKLCTLAFLPLSGSHPDRLRFEEKMKFVFGQDLAVNSGNIFNSAYLLVQNGDGGIDTTVHSNLPCILKKLEKAINQVQ